MTRTLTPELLDSLPSQHPDALRSRRDLRWINFAMGNHRWFARTLPPLLRPGDRVLLRVHGRLFVAVALTREVRRAWKKAVVASSDEAVFPRAAGHDHAANVQPLAVRPRRHQHGGRHEIFVPRRTVRKFSRGLRDQIDG